MTVRPRVLDPDIWKDDLMLELSPRQQLIFIGLVTLANDNGWVSGDSGLLSRKLTSFCKHMKKSEFEHDLRRILELMCSSWELAESSESCMKFSGVIRDFRRFIWRNPTRVEWQRLANILRPQVFERDEHRCVQCGSTDRLEVDHVVAIARGGSNDIENLQTLCLPCNRSKGAS